MPITAINKKYQRTVLRAYQLNRSYAEIVNRVDLCNTEKEVERNERLQEIAFNKYEEKIEDLPQREIDNLDRQHLKIHGYK